MRPNTPSVSRTFMLIVLAACLLAPAATAQIAGITASAVDLVAPPDSTKDQVLSYGLGFPFQVSPKRAAVFCNVRVEGVAIGDYENGTDVIMFDNLATIDATNAVAISRDERRTGANGKKRLVVKFPVTGGFVPMGALRKDGSPHPHAGTGFGICQAISFPVDDRGHFNWKTKRIHRCEVHQFSCDGERFKAVRSASGMEQPHPLVEGSAWQIIMAGITNAIPDGDDMLLASLASGGSPSVSGVARWARVGGVWKPVEFSPVTPPGEGWSEASLVRDTDGALLFSARGSGGDRFTEVRVWRRYDEGPHWRLVFSTSDVRVLHKEDGGPKWRQAIRVLRAHSPSPISINRAADGTPFIAANLLGSGREMLCIWPLNAARTALLKPITARAARKEFGAAQRKSRWMVDHPSGAVVRLSDGQWHAVLAYRILGQAEHWGAGPAPQTGCYIEEVRSNGPVIPTWRFK